jgi:hypothetical protein
MFNITRPNVLAGRPMLCIECSRLTSQPCMIVDVEACDVHVLCSTDRLQPVPVRYPSTVGTAVRS